MAGNILNWLKTDRQPRDLYELLGVKLFDPDTRKLRAAVVEATRDILPYQTHSDRKIAQRAHKILNLLGTADGVLSNAGKSQALQDRLVRQLHKRFLEDQGAAPDSVPASKLNAWLKREGRVHPDALRTIGQQVLMAGSVSANPVAIIECPVCLETVAADKAECSHCGYALHPSDANRATGSNHTRELPPLPFSGNVAIAYWRRAGTPAKAGIVTSAAALFLLPIILVAWSLLGSPDNSQVAEGTTPATIEVEVATTPVVDAAEPSDSVAVDPQLVATSPPVSPGSPESPTVIAQAPPQAVSAIDSLSTPGTEAAGADTAGTGTPVSPQEPEVAASEEPMDVDAGVTATPAPQPAPTTSPASPEEPVVTAEQPPSTVVEEKHVATEDEFQLTEDAADGVIFPEDGLELISTVRAKYELTPEQETTVQEWQEEWQKMADAKLARLGRKWVSRDSVAAAATQASDLIAEAKREVGSNNLKKAEQLLERASRSYVSGFEAEFILGLMYSVPVFRDVDTMLGDAKSAARHFRVALARSPGHLPTLTNLALAELKTGDFTEALKRWREVASRDIHSPELLQNLGRLGQELAAKRAVMPEKYMKRFEELYNDVSKANKNRSHNANMGFLYSPKGLPPNATHAVRPTNLMVLVQAGLGDITEYVEDISCVSCGGAEWHGCAVKGCTRGVVSVPFIVKQRVPGTNRTAAIKKFRSERCSNCRGNGRLDCPWCTTGRDPRL